MEPWHLESWRLGSRKPLLRSSLEAAWMLKGWRLASRRLSNKKLPEAMRIRHR
jgi:hypothetical protein